MELKTLVTSRDCDWCGTTACQQKVSTGSHRELRSAWWRREHMMALIQPIGEHSCHCQDLIVLTVFISFGADGK